MGKGCHPPATTRPLGRALLLGMTFLPCAVTQPPLHLPSLPPPLARPQVNKLDLCAFLASCCGCLFISIEIGLGIAIGLTVLMNMYQVGKPHKFELPGAGNVHSSCPMLLTNCFLCLQSAFPHTAVLGKVPGSSYVYRNVKQYPDSLVCPGILAFRIGGALGCLLP